MNGGDLVDSFGEWLREAQDLMPSITGSPFVANVAQSPEGSQYWSERDGWGDLDDATAFFANGARGLTTDPLAEWTAVELAAAREDDAETEAGPRG